MAGQIYINDQLFTRNLYWVVPVEVGASPPDDYNAYKAPKRLTIQALGHHLDMIARKNGWGVVRLPGNMTAVCSMGRTLYIDFNDYDGPIKALVHEMGQISEHIFLKSDGSIDLERRLATILDGRATTVNYAHEGQAAKVYAAAISFVRHSSSWSWGDLLLCHNGTGVSFRATDDGLMMIGSDLAFQPERFARVAYELEKLSELSVDNDKVQRVLAARQAIVADVGMRKKDQYHRGQTVCPVCGNGRLTYIYHGHSNGHVEAKCSTPDCVDWVE